MELIRTNIEESELRSRLVSAAKREEFADHSRSIYKIAYGTIDGGGVAKRIYSSPDNCAGGLSAAFYVVVGSDGVSRVVCDGEIDLYDVDHVEDAPWFDGSAASRRANEFVAVVEGDEAQELLADLDAAQGDFDVYNAQAYAQDLMRIFLRTIGAPLRCHDF